MAEAEVKYEGQAVKMGDRTYIVPPLTFKQIRKFEADLKSLADAKDADVNPYDRLTKSVPIIHAALSRNYPDLTPESVEDLLDLHNYRKVIEAVMGVSGISELRLGELKPEPAKAASATAGAQSTRP